MLYVAVTRILTVYSLRFEALTPVRTSHWFGLFFHPEDPVDFQRATLPCVPEDRDVFVFSLIPRGGTR
jgi:hypothetical protein